MLDRSKCSPNVEKYEFARYRARQGWLNRLILRIISDPPVALYHIDGSYQDLTSLGSRSFSEA